MNFKRIECPLFLCGKIKMVFTCFPSLMGIRALVHKINFHRNYNFGHRQDAKQADPAGQKLLFGVNCSLMLLILVLLMAILWVYLPKYSTTNIGLSKGFLANTTLGFCHNSGRIFSLNDSNLL